MTAYTPALAEGQGSSESTLDASPDDGDTMDDYDFMISVDAIGIAVRYRDKRISGYSHFEFTNHEGRHEPIPVSQTGYRSHFVHASFVEMAGGPEAFAKAYCLAVLRNEDRPHESDEHDVEESAGRQPSLFD
ncbi:hypothetical protein [Singulisphaera sp. PoT]|uniref:hypothetical protein n=1 Tax=Singulisphaera sp. PoT TaxID=3411797 RepID=UPI003BF58AD6